MPVAVSVSAINVSFPFRCFLSFLISDHHTTLASITAYHPPKRRAKEITIRYLPRFHIVALIALPYTKSPIPYPKINGWQHRNFCPEPDIQSRSICTGIIE